MVALEPKLSGQGEVGRGGPLWSGYWGKAGPASPDGCYHPVAYHCLDVAAVGLELLHRQPLLHRRLEALSGISAKPLLDWVTFLLGLHDLGKLTDGFQNLRPDLRLELQGLSVPTTYPERHDLLTLRLWEEVLEGEVFDHDEDLRDLVRPWVEASAGHHGAPPARPASPAPICRLFRPEAVEHARALVRWLQARFLASGLPFESEPYEENLSRAQASSWLFAGLAVVADWIGSNTAWFPFRLVEMELDTYWDEFARPQAQRAVAAAGLEEVGASAATGLSSLWPALSHPTDLQAHAESTPLTTGPQLFVIEEVTGGGKTEAAMVLAHRLLAERRATGIFVALPTMATANAMFSRVAPMVERLFAEPGASVTLAHSKRHLMALEATERGGPYAAQESTASQDCSDWLADSRKKALLAHVGVGTIDQALLGILPIRHQSLRLWGLAGKVLIVDEVHACDTYVLGLLEVLLRFHAAFKGSAILLSATLPKHQRRSLLTAFATGLGTSPPVDELGEAYPLVTHLSADGLESMALEARPEACRTVEVEMLTAPQEASSWIVDAVRQGRCACWVRNTVADAIEGWEAIRRELGEDRVHLFHSRFTVQDRQRIELDTLRRFGPQSQPEKRRGHVLVATQVVEQSLDLDFDDMVVDLAPIDLVVQRAGRLRRHARERSGARTSGADQRGVPVLGVLAPPAGSDADANWYERLFPRASFVYEDHGRLWLTADWLSRTGAFRMPEDARVMLEHVYGEESSSRIPQGLRARTTRSEGTTAAARALARLYALKLEEGYTSSLGQWPEDAYAPTRLGEPTVTLRLLRKTSPGFEPWYQTPDHPWERSQVQVREREIAGEAISDGLSSELRSRMKDEGRWVLLVVLEDTPRGWEGHGCSPAGALRTVRYDPVRGLEVVQMAREP